MFQQGLFRREIKGGRFSGSNSLYVACVLPIGGVKFLGYQAVDLSLKVKEYDFVGLPLAYIYCPQQDPWGHVLSAFCDVHTNIWIVCRIFPKYQSRIQELFCGLSGTFLAADVSKFTMKRVDITGMLVYPIEIERLCQFRPLSHFSNPENLQSVDDFSFKGGE